MLEKLVDYLEWGIDTVQLGETLACKIHIGQKSRRDKTSLTYLHQQRNQVAGSATFNLTSSKLLYITASQKENPLIKTTETDCK